MQVNLSPRARIDIRDILRFTQRTWGIERKIKYASEFEAILMTLEDHPEIGIERTDLMIDLRSFNVNQHVLYYRIIADEIRVDRILHKRQDAAATLKIDYS